MRKPWDEYFLEIAKKVSKRATCDRRHVGTVIVRNRNILTSGYNGSMIGAPHCDDVGHLMKDGHCVRTIHSEVNSVIQAGKNGVCIDGATAYVTCAPCWNCFKVLVNAGIKRIVYSSLYRHHEHLDMGDELGVKVEFVPLEEKE